MKITFIGGGNMGGAIARGAVSKQVVKAENVTISDPSAQVQASFAEFDAKININADNAEAIIGSDLIIVAVKPWLVEPVFQQIKDTLDAKTQMVVSIAAGISFDMLKSYLNEDNIPSLFRVIPNTAITLGESATFVCSEGTTAEQTKVVCDLLSALGSVFEVEESQMASLTALASCGIAYIFKYIDASIKGGVEMGIEQSMAQEIVMQTVKGALCMLETNKTQPQTEIDKVTTPGGITLKGLEQMEKSGFTQAVIDGLKASK